MDNPREASAMRRWARLTVLSAMLGGLAPGALAAPRVHSRVHCARCDVSIPPGRAGRRCPDCRLIEDGKEAS